jgi:hypothetical protein
MVRMRGLQLPVCLGVAFASVGCDATGPVPDFDETPTIALLITPEPPPPGPAFPSDTGLYAALVVTGTPVRSPYLHADRFEMRRASDGARFAWRAVDPPSDAIGVFPQTRGNYFLPRRVNDAGLGSDSIAPGGVYDLVVEAGLHRIVGRTRVPGTIEFVRGPTDGDSIVRWRRVPGAAAYDIRGQFFGLGVAAIEDTAFVIRRVPEPGQPSGREFARIFALDSNFAAFRSDLRASGAGISGGWGVFGSFTWADTELLPPTAASAPR